MEHQGKINFCWPTIDDIYPVIGGLHPENSTGLPDPVIDRRGSTLTFRQKLFGKVLAFYFVPFFLNFVTFLDILSSFSGSSSS